MAQLANLTTTLAIESASFVNGIEQSRGAVRKLVASLDPAAAAQAKFNRQMDLAERGLKSGQISADLYEKVIARLKSQLDATSVSGGTLTRTGGQMRAGMQQLSYQLGDVATGLATGQRAMTIFAQQSGQVIQAIQLMSGEAKGLLGVLGGPWGIALTAAITVATSFGATLFKSKDAGQAAKEGYLAAADGADRLADALKRVNSIGTTLAQQDAIDIGDQITKKQADIANIQKAIDATRGGSRVVNYLGPAERFFDTKDLNAAKADLKTLQDSLQIANARLSAQDRINAAQDKYEQGLKDEAASRKASNKEAREAESAAKKAAREALADAKAQADLVAKASAGAYKAIAGLESDQHKSLMKVFGDDAGAWNDMAKKAQAAFSGMQNVEIGNERDLQRIREGHIRDLAGLYQDLFTGGTKALWRDFQQLGFSVIAKLVAEWTAGAFSPTAANARAGNSGFSFSNLFSAIGSSLGLGGHNVAAPAGTFNIPGVGSNIPYIVPGFANGGSFQFGGRDGIDKNILSLNGSPIAKVSKGETATIGTGGGGGASYHFHLEGAVVTQDLLDQMNQIGAQSVARAAPTLIKGATAHTMDTISRKQNRRLGR